MNRQQVRDRLNKLNVDKYSFDNFYSFAQELMHSSMSREEILGFVDSLQDRATELKPNLPKGAQTIDLSGTGGDKIKTINVGSIASIILSRHPDIYVGKQSTRAYTGLTGSKDVYEYLGVPVDLVKSDTKEIEHRIQTAHFAAYYYPAFSKNFENTKSFFQELSQKGMGFITPWHVAAWLYNPLHIKYRMYGMFTDEYLDVAADVLMQQGVEKGWVYHGVAGIDELSNICETKVIEFENGNKKEMIISPEDFGLNRAVPSDITVKSKEESLEIAKDIIEGKDRGPHSEIVRMNIAAALYLTGISKDLKSAMEKAKELESKK